MQVSLSILLQSTVPLTIKEVSNGITTNTNQNSKAMKGRGMSPPHLSFILSHRHFRP